MLFPIIWLVCSLFSVALFNFMVYKNYFKNADATDYLKFMAMFALMGPISVMVLIPIFAIEYLEDASSEFDGDIGAWMRSKRKKKE